MADQPSLTVLGGPLGGRRFAFEDDGDSVLIGSDPSCTFRLELPDVSPIHARVRREGGGLTVFDTHSPRGLFVNDDRVTTQMPLRNGDVLWLGTPGEAGVLMIQCRVPPSAVAATAALPVDTEEPSPPEPPVRTSESGSMYVEPIVEDVIEEEVSPTVAFAPDPELEPEPTVRMGTSPAFEPPKVKDTDSFFDDNETQAISPRTTAWSGPSDDDLPTSFTVEPPPRPAPAPLPFEDETTEPPEELAPTIVVPPRPAPVAAPPAPPVASRPAPPVPGPRPAAPPVAARPRPGTQSMPPRPATPPAPRRPGGGGGGDSRMPLIAGGGLIALIAVGAGVYFFVLKKDPEVTSTTATLETPAPVATALPVTPTAVAVSPTEAVVETPTAAPVEAATPVEEIVTIIKPPTPSPRPATTATKATPKTAATAPPVAAANPAVQAAGLKAQGDRALAAGQFDAAIGHFDEALRLSAGDAEATAGRARATAARDALRRRFVAGTTSVKSAKEAKTKLTGFEDVKVAQAAEYSGRIDFDVKPDRVKPGDSYVIRVSLTNDGKKSFKLSGVTVNPVTNGARSGGPIAPRAKEVDPLATVLIEEFPGVWPEGTTSWSMEVVVTSNRGDTFRNQLTWK